MLSYKSLNSPAPQYSTELFTKLSEGNGLNRRSSETKLQIPVLRTSIGQNAYCYRGAKLWNELSREAKVTSSLKTFKRSNQYLYFDILIFHLTFGTYF